MDTDVAPRRRLLLCVQVDELEGVLERDLPHVSRFSLGYPKVAVLEGAQKDGVRAVRWSHERMFSSAPGFVRKVRESGLTRSDPRAHGQWVTVLQSEGVFLNGSDGHSFRGPAVRFDEAD
jgi:hypothetical protein